MTGLTPGYEPETGQVILEGRPAGVAGEARLVPVSGAELAFDRAGGHLSRVVVDTARLPGRGPRLVTGQEPRAGSSVTTVTRRFRPEVPGAIRSLAPCPTMTSADPGIPRASKKDATLAARR